MTPADQDILHLSIGRQASHRGSNHMDSPSFFPLALMISFVPACSVLVDSCNLRLCRLFDPPRNMPPPVSNLIQIVHIHFTQQPACTNTPNCSYKETDHRFPPGTTQDGCVIRLRTVGSRWWHQPRQWHSL